MQLHKIFYYNIIFTYIFKNIKKRFILTLTVLIFEVVERRKLH